MMLMICCRKHHVIICKEIYEYGYNYAVLDSCMGKFHVMPHVHVWTHWGQVFVHILCVQLIENFVTKTSYGRYVSWWRHEIEAFSASLSFCAGNSPVNSPHKGQWRGALMLSLICTWINGWVNNREAGWFETPSHPLWRHRNVVLTQPGFANKTSYDHYVEQHRCHWIV